MAIGLGVLLIRIRICAAAVWRCELREVAPPDITTGKSRSDLRWAAPRGPVKFALDSPLEGDGFEIPVPRGRAGCKACNRTPPVGRFPLRAGECLLLRHPGPQSEGTGVHDPLKSWPLRVHPGDLPGDVLGEFSKTIGAAS